VALGKIQNARSKARGLGFGDPKAKRRPRGCPRGFVGVSLRENGKEIANPRIDSGGNVFCSISAQGGREGAR